MPIKASLPIMCTPDLRDTLPSHMQHSMHTACWCGHIHLVNITWHDAGSLLDLLHMLSPAGPWQPGTGGCPSSTETPFFNQQKLKHFRNEACVTQLCDIPPDASGYTDEQENCIRECMSRPCAAAPPQSLVMHGCDTEAGHWTACC